MTNRRAEPLSVFSLRSLRSVAATSSSERAPDIPAGRDLGVELGILQVLLGYVLSQTQVFESVVGEEAADIDQFTGGSAYT